MDITGWDEVVFTFSPPRQVFARVLAAVQRRWPAARMDGLEGLAPSEVVPAAGIPMERLPAADGHLMFYRDAAMVKHCDQHAYNPMADGEGIFSVITRIRRDVEFEVASLNEVRAADRGPIRVDPYPAWLCTPEVVEVTAVTPDDPAGHPFSAWVLEQVKRACLGPAIE